MFYNDLKDYITEYGKNNGELLQSELIKNIIDENEKEYLNELPEELKKINSRKLSVAMYNILIESLKNKEEQHISMKNLSLLLKKLYKEKIHTEKVKKAALYLITSSLLVSGGVKIDQFISSSNKHGKSIIIENRDYIETNPDFERVSREKAIQKEKEEKYRMGILYNFSEINSLQEIYDRQNSLESLNLTDEDKIYKDCPLSPEIQWFIYQLSITNGYPVNLAFSIIDTETMGEFNSSGEISYNTSTNYDLGLTQQNSDYSVKSLFCEKYDVNFFDGCDLVRYNDYANLVACFLKFNEIRENLPEDYDINEFAGYYNGWCNWRNNSISRNYVERFDLAYTKKFKN